MFKKKLPYNPSSFFSSKKKDITPAHESTCQPKKRKDNPSNSELPPTIASSNEASPTIIDFPS
ncbi:hypothetical protein FRX31_015197 [Thalictrum thalictroides]|uniref:Uncharacterized protein n=1 Tax=Thalictrum thalictroides TaxID=46969 RepID=A0A7J6WCQ5_THATH|nr:hypothetical protein FRX31_015197 [Thalictrum thalictroides]